MAGRLRIRSTYKEGDVNPLCGSFHPDIPRFRTVCRVTVSDANYRALTVPGSVFDG
jgi:hypothetical protein